MITSAEGMNGIHNKSKGSKSLADLSDLSQEREQYRIGNQGYQVSARLTSNRVSNLENKSQKYSPVKIDQRFSQTAHYLTAANGPKRSFDQHLKSSMGITAGRMQRSSLNEKRESYQSDAISNAATAKPGD